MQMALFDLDHTLIPFDSGREFTRFLAERGALPETFAAQYLGYCEQYAAGRVDMRAMHRFTVGALAVHTPQRLAAWLDEFEGGIAPLVPPASHELVREHQAAGHVCALVTATTRLIAERFARVLGLADVLASEPVFDARGHCTGEVIGEPCFREHKCSHVRAWLARGGRGWADVTRSWFYSDSANDLPLLAAVSDPVAVNPDAALAAHAAAAGWPVRRIGPAVGAET
jgi:HAD superfamily hydrolase (TIGR01490 family)